MMKYTYQAPDGTLKTVSLSRLPDGSYTATIGEQTYPVRLERAHNHQLLLKIGEQNLFLHGVRRGSLHYMAYNGQTITLEKTAAGGRTTKNQHAGDLTASMPGQITQVLVKSGDHVEKGQTLVVMEAMKMEMRIKAPYDGIIHKLLCTEGTTVDQGQLLIEVIREPENNAV